MGEGSGREGGRSEKNEQKRFSNLARNAPDRPAGSNEKESRSCLSLSRAPHTHTPVLRYVHFSSVTPTQHLEHVRLSCPRIRARPRCRSSHTKIFPTQNKLLLDETTRRSCPSRGRGGHKLGPRGLSRGGASLRGSAHDTQRTGQARGSRGFRQVRGGAVPGVPSPRRPAILRDVDVPRRGCRARGRRWVDARFLDANQLAFAFLNNGSRRVLPRRAERLGGLPPRRGRETPVRVRTSGLDDVLKRFSFCFGPCASA
mmetsp:Transcript_2536/g.9794  ORF Transcript_2536/g.9794 Transcript_2536/m.9794 type:complete len:257 (-) Transcript_2536:47-817(-)